MGKGAFGEVVLVIHKGTNEKRALKKIPKKDMTKVELETLMNEVNILKQLVKQILNRTILIFLNYIAVTMKRIYSG